MGPKVKEIMYGDQRGGRGGGGFTNDRSMTPPVREGEEIDVTIEAVGEKGDGIAKQKGFVLFVPGTKAGERVKIRITRVLSKVGFAQVIGPATTEAGAKPERHERKAEPDFEAKEELDTEDFGDDSGEPADAEEEEEQ
jgi:predicted RNA-binding protein with TRAM domain